MRKNVIGFGIYVPIDEEGMVGDLLRLKHEAWAKAAKYFDAEVPQARALLEVELRSIIGPIHRDAS